MQTLNQNTGMDAIQFMCHEYSTPRSVINAVRIIWATLAISFAYTLYAIKIGEITTEHFFSSLVIHAFACLVPYKLYRGSNAARFCYLMLVIIATLLVMFTTASEITKPGITGSLLVLPLGGWASVLLLRKETTIWLNSLLQKPEFLNLKNKHHQSKWSLYKKAVLDK